MVAIKNVLLSMLTATACASVLPTRDISAIQKALNTVDADLKDLTSKTNAWNGSTSGAIPIQQAGKKLNDDIDAATTTAKSAPTPTSAESQTIIDYVNNTITPDAKLAIDALINQQAKIRANPDLLKVVRDRLASLKTSTTALADALIAKATSDKKSAATTAKSNVLAQIQRGIDTFAK